MLFDVVSVVPSVLKKHRNQGYHEEGDVDIGNEVGLRVRVICEYSLWHDQLAMLSTLLRVKNGAGAPTLAKKLEAVQRNTVASSSNIPTACLHFDLGGFLPSLHTLTWLAGLRMGLARSPSYTMGPSSLCRGDVAVLRGGGGMTENGGSRGRY